MFTFSCHGLNKIRTFYYPSDISLVLEYQQKDDNDKAKATVELSAKVTSDIFCIAC
jgi:hypothetical protein